MLVHMGGSGPAVPWLGRTTQVSTEKHGANLGHRALSGDFLSDNRIVDVTAENPRSSFA